MRIDRGLGARTFKLNMCKVVQSKIVNGGSVKAEGNLGSVHKQVYESSRVLGQTISRGEARYNMGKREIQQRKMRRKQTSGCGLVSVFSCDLIGPRTAPW